MVLALRGTMLHYARRAVPDADLFHTWAEARYLWLAIASRVAGIVALTLMPDHLHLLVRDAVDRPLMEALRSYALWRNHRRGEVGPVLRPGDRPRAVEGRTKIQRNIRYIALNPCRAKLVADPLAWPFSTHRDRMGLALYPLVPPVRDPAREHAYVSSDPTCAVSGSELPLLANRVEDVELHHVIDAVSAVTRATPAELRRRGPARALLLQAAATWCAVPPTELARALSCGRSTLFRARAEPRGDGLRLVERVLGDPRFAALPDGDLRRLPSFRGRWGRTRGWRGRPMAG